MRVDNVGHVPHGSGCVRFVLGGVRRYADDAGHYNGHARPYRNDESRLGWNRRLRPEREAQNADA